MSIVSINSIIIILFLQLGFYSFRKDIRKDYTQRSLYASKYRRGSLIFLFLHFIPTLILILCRVYLPSMLGREEDYQTSY